MVYATPAFSKINVLHHGITALLEFYSKLHLLRQKGLYLRLTHLWVISAENVFNDSIPHWVQISAML